MNKDRALTVVIVLLLIIGLLTAVFVPFLVSKSTLRDTRDSVEEMQNKIDKMEAEHKSAVETALSRGYKMYCYGQDFTNTPLDELWGRFTFRIIDSEKTIIVK